MHQGLFNQSDVTIGRKTQQIRKLPHISSAQAFE